MNIKQRLKDAIYGKGVEPIPFDILAITLLTELLNAMMGTSVFAYLPHLLKSFGISEMDTGKYAGFVVSSMTVVATLFSLVVGYLCDKYPKQNILLISCLVASASTIAFGFSSNFTLAIVFRSLQGLPALLVSSQSLLFERCSDSNKGVGMSLSLSTYSTGLVLGPAIGGYLSFPARNGSIFENNEFFESYPVLLPNALLGSMFLGLAVTTRFLKTKAPYEKGRSREVSINLYGGGKVSKTLLLSHWNKPIETINQGDPVKSKEIPPELNDSSFIAVLKNRKCLSSCLYYGIFTFIALGFNEIYPVWAATDRINNGLALSTKQIGNSYMGAAIFLIFVQAILLTKLSQVMHEKKMFILGLCTQSVSYMIYPILVNVQNRILLWVPLCALIIITRFAVGACFVSAIIIVNRSVSSNLIGKANGLATAVSGVSRSLSPILFGLAYSWSLTNIEGVSINHRVNQTEALTTPSAKHYISTTTTTTGSNNKHPLGFPFNQYFAFLLMSILSFVTMICTMFPRTSTPKYSGYNNIDEITENQQEV